MIFRSPCPINPELVVLWEPTRQVRRVTQGGLYGWLLAIVVDSQESRFHHIASHSHFFLWRGGHQSMTDIWFSVLHDIKMSKSWYLCNNQYFVFYWSASAKLSTHQHHDISLHYYQRHNHNHHPLPSWWRCAMYEIAATSHPWVGGKLLPAAKLLQVIHSTIPDQTKLYQIILYHTSTAL